MKKIFPFGLLLILMLLMSSPAAADDFARLRDESANIKTIRARFIQKKFMKILSRPLVSDGKFYYAAPASFRWEYVAPVKSIALAYKGEVKKYSQSGGKMVEDQTGGARAMKIVLNDVLAWMSGHFDQNPAFAATLREGTYTEITLKPVGDNFAGLLEKIEIIVARKDRTIKSIKITENKNDYTLIEFKDVEVNQPVSDSVFQVI